MANKLEHAEAENIAMHGPPPYTEHQPQKTGMEEGVMAPPSAQVTPASPPMTEDKAGDFKDIDNVDMDLDLLNNKDQAVEVDNTVGVSVAYIPGKAGVAVEKGVPTDGNTGGGEMLGSKTNTKLTFAIELFTSPTQVLAPIATASRVLALCTPANRIIPLDAAMLEAIQNTQEVLIYRNTHPKSTGDSVAFVSMTINHRVQGADPGDIMYSSIKGTYKLILKADPLTSTQALYKKEGGSTLATAPIEHLRNLC